MFRNFSLALLLLTAACAAPPPSPTYDLVLHGGLVYDGSGAPPVRTDVAIVSDRIAALGDFSDAPARRRVDVTGLAVAPGFINMLSWATESMLLDGTAPSDLRQGVTLEVFGEGWSMGPLNDAMKASQIEDAVAEFGSVEAFAEAIGAPHTPGEPFEWPWTTLGAYLSYLEAKGIAPNVASFVGATTLRIHEIGYDDRPPTADELARMQALVRQAMEEGAMGVGSSLIYAPAFYADTDELVALAAAAAPYGGRYISHMRSEGNRLVEALDELLHIAREAGIGAEVYHLKAAGRPNWGKLDAVIARIEAAQAEGLDVTANMYTYTAGATGLDAAMPPWVQEGGYDAWAERLQDPATRARVAAEMCAPTDEWENFFVAAGPDNMLLTGFRNPDLKPYTGMTLREIAAQRGTSPAETAMDLVVEDGTRVGTVYFLMSEDNVRRQLQLPWVSFGSDAGALAPVPPFNRYSTHPRAYGNFARLLGRYVRDEGVLSLHEAIRRLTALPADNLGISDRGRLTPGHFADIVVFDPATIRDHATFADPHQFSTGVHHVWVNGHAALFEGEPTGTLPGRFVRGPGFAAAPR